MSEITTIPISLLQKAMRVYQVLESIRFNVDQIEYVAFDSNEELIIFKDSDENYVTCSQY